ncbi:MAG TPA: SAM-dependent chlorinase/fluorinase [Candidatus Sulfotelmatobacter sp.]|nr:SAM-dependent chlorinase/fluorinase [Candidatus Sulfotelmatobacter sp.]
MVDRPFVSLLTDFGVRDPSAGIMRAVILGLAPEANVVDISHEVAKYQVRDGALLLWCAAPYLPVGCHVAVVDPGVGTERRPIAVRVHRGDVLIGPDNGLLLPAAERLGGIVDTRSLASAEHRLPVVSSSFHGRDIFAPAAAHLANGVPLAALGPEIPADGLVRLPWPPPEARDQELAASVLYVDTFGNVKLGAEAADLRRALGEVAWGTPLRLDRAGGRATIHAIWAETFGRVAPGAALVYEDSYGRLCLAVNRGDAAAAFGLHEDDRLAIRLV